VRSMPLQRLQENKIKTSGGHRPSNQVKSSIGISVVINSANIYDAYILIG